MRRRSLRDDRGSTSVELVILAPLIGILLLSVVVVGRVQVARADVEGAARSAARQIAIARDPQSAISSAQSGAGTSLDVGSPSCRTMTFTSSITEEWVTVTVSCVVDLDDASVLPVPGSMTVTATATEIIDAHRERGGDL
jgi:Flp pilus assembly protein TadG